MGANITLRFAHRCTTHGRKVRTVSESEGLRSVVGPLRPLRAAFDSEVLCAEIPRLADLARKVGHCSAIRWALGGPPFKPTNVARIYG